MLVPFKIAKSHSNNARNIVRHLDKYEDFLIIKLSRRHCPPHTDPVKDRRAAANI